MHDLTIFSMSDMTRCGMSLRKLASTTSSMEEAADKVVRHPYENLIDPSTGENAFALIRLFKTHYHEDLDPDLRAFASGILKGEAAPPQRTSSTSSPARPRRRESSTPSSSIRPRPSPSPSTSPTCGSSSSTRTT